MHAARDLAAALVAPWPTWRIAAPDEAGLLDLLAGAGPSPQADLFEPWEPLDLWRARVLWPDLADPAGLLAGGVLEAGVAPGLSEWVDRGRVGEERLDGDGLRAVCLHDLEDGDLLIPDLLREPAIDLSLARELLAAVGSLGPPDRASAVRHRLTGRPGVLLEVAVADRDPLAERQVVIDGVAEVAARRTLAPDARWWFEAGRMFVLTWRVAPTGRGLPDDGSVAGQLHLHAGPAELHVALPPTEHDAAASSLGQALGEIGWQGSRARWGRVDGRPAFLACWEGPGETARAARDVVAAHPHRVVPGCPAGLEPDWLGVDPAFWMSADRTVVRWRCGLRDRDLLPVCLPRPGDAIDRRLTDLLAPLGPCEPVWAGSGALRLELPALDGAAWDAVVRALCALPEPEVGPVIPVAMRDRFTVLLTRLDLSVETPPAWSIR